jgi:shikimate kinase
MTKFPPMIFFLIGLPGCGKSTLGRKFAYVLGLPFYDLDHLIEAGEGAEITDLFSLHGDKKFREIEQQYLQKVKGLDKAVIATGGGTPCFFNNMELINSLGMSVFLDVPPREIAHRLSENGIAKRPILNGKSREEICLTLEHLRQIRLPYYSKSHITLTNPDIRFNEVLLEGYHKGS